MSGSITPLAAARGVRPVGLTSENWGIVASDGACTVSAYVLKGVMTPEANASFPRPIEAFEPTGRP